MFLDISVVNVYVFLVLFMTANQMYVLDTVLQLFELRFVKVLVCITHFMHLNESYSN